MGLSSGTSGNRGVFLVSKAERLRWAGILLARTLPPHLLRHLLSPWHAPLRIAFFLRANSNLYTTLNSRRIQFTFHDLLRGVEAAVPQLNANPPDVLVAPPPVLRALAAEAFAGRLRIQPSHIIAVAEVLESRDADSVHSAFGQIPHQIYQATEGFLAYTCEYGSLHLNESFVQVEREWLDAEHTRFQPVITDFTRDTQLIVRYRLNDVLRVRAEHCSCGRAEHSIAAIEGRADEVLWLPAHNGKVVAVFPDFIRRAMLLVGEQIREFAVQQHGMTLHIGLLLEGDSSQVQCCCCAVGGFVAGTWHTSPDPAFHRLASADIRGKTAAGTNAERTGGLVMHVLILGARPACLEWAWCSLPAAGKLPSPIRCAGLLRVTVVRHSIT